MGVHDHIADILNGRYGASFQRIVEIIIAGHGRLQTDSISFVLNS